MSTLANTLSHLESLEGHIQAVSNLDSKRFLRKEDLDELNSKQRTLSKYGENACKSVASSRQ